MRNIVMNLFKRMICKHRYKRICVFSGNHIETSKEVIFEYDFECTKCGKVLHVEMDRQYQIDA